MNDPGQGEGQELRLGRGRSRPELTKMKLLMIPDMLLLYLLILGLCMHFVRQNVLLFCELVWRHNIHHSLSG